MSAGATGTLSVTRLFRPTAAENKQRRRSFHARRRSHSRLCSRLQGGAGGGRRRGVGRRASISLLIKTSHPNKCRQTSQPLTGPDERGPSGPDVCLSEDKYRSGSFLWKRIRSLRRSPGLTGAKENRGIVFRAFPAPEPFRSERRQLSAFTRSALGGLF